MSEEGPDGRQQEIRLTPPPRIEPVGAKLDRRRDPAHTGRTGPAIVPAVRLGRPRWVAPLAWGLLALIAALGAYLGVESTGDAVVRGAPETTGDTGATPPFTDSPVEGLAPSNEAAGGDPAPATAEPTAAAREAPGSAVTRPAPTSRDTEFGRAMAAGLAAIDAGDFESARAALSRAAALDPSSPEPAAARQRLEAAATRIDLEERRARAAALVAAEAWPEAAAEYRAVLEVDPTLTFAREGLALAEARAALGERLDFHLGRPERLAAAEVLSEVDRLLETAHDVEDPGPRHTAQVAALADLVARVRLPVRVSLLSDDRTEVTVHQVGRLGTFDRRELELRPGTYTVVGSRAGYRDVRRQLKVEPGRPPEPLEIRCEEKI